MRQAFLMPKKMHRHRLNLVLIGSILCGLTRLCQAAPEAPVLALDFEPSQPFAEPVLSKLARVTTEDSQSGKQSLQVSGVTPNQTFHTALTLEVPQIQPGRFYRLGVWVRTSPTVLPNNMVSVQIKDKVLPGAALVPIDRGARGWQHFEGEIFVPAQWRQPVLRLGAYLTQGEWARFDNVTLELLPPRVEGSFICYSDRQTVEVKFNAASFLSALGKDAVQGKIVWRDSKGKTVLEKSIDAFPTPEAVFEFDIRDLPQDRYAIALSVLDKDNRTLDEKTLPFEVFRKPEWAGNSIGLLEPGQAPPAPWTPLIYKRTRSLATAFGGPAPDEIEGEVPDTVECWGRKQEFTSGPLPSQITALEQPLLAAPIRFQIETAQGTFEPKHWEWTSEATGPQNGQFRFEAQQQGLRVSGKMEIEFDGMMKYSIRLEPVGGDPIAIKRLSLQLPLRAEQSTLFNCPTIQSWEERDEVAAKTGDWKLEKWQPYIWMGTETRGLAWFAETDKDWRAGTEPFAQARTEGERRLVSINMISEPMEITKPLEYVFGLQATPTRPHIEAWPEMRFRTAEKNNLELFWANPKITRYFGFPALPEDGGKFLKESIASKRKEGYRWLLVYQMLSFAPEALPEWEYYWHEWMLQPRVRDAGVYTPVTAVDVRRRDWQDLQAWYLKNYLQQFDLNGIYIDGGGGPQQTTEGWNIFAARDLLKRAYILTHQLKPDALVWVHGGFTPVSSFSDLLLMGEQYRQPLYRDPYYLGFMTLKQFRQELVADMGQPRLLLSQLQGPAQLEKKPTVHTMGLALLHDLDVYPHTLNQEVFDDMSKYRVKYKGANFTGYWQPGGHVQSSSPEIVVSYYQMKDRMLAVLLNTSPQPATTEVTLDLKNLAMPATVRLKIYDPLTGREVNAKQSDHFSATIEGYSAILTEAAPP